MSVPEGGFKAWFERDTARTLAAQFAAVQPGFDAKRFVRRATKGLAPLEMMDRVRQFADALEEELPDDPAALFDVVVRSLPPAKPPTSGGDDRVFDEKGDAFRQWPLSELIARRSLEAPDAALEAMLALTQVFTSEFAVRPLLREDPARVLARFAEWAEHPNMHARRWCSEGSRPRLPWGGHLPLFIADPAPMFPILRKLEDDPELYVRRSVANHWNDIAKDHPARVVAEARRLWKAKCRDRAAREAMVRHMLRTLIKAGDPGALSVIGYKRTRTVEASVAVQVEGTKRKTPSLPIGGTVAFEVTLRNAGRRAQALLVDYALHYVKKRGETSPKVFKGTELRLAAGATETLTFRRPMKHVSIRRLHPGTHRVEILVNGASLAEGSFELLG